MHHRKKLVSRLCHACFFFLLLLLLFCVFWFASIFKFSSERFKHDRYCVDIHRHRVLPSVPAIDGPTGGSNEPFAFGWIAIDLKQNEISWRIGDALAVQPAAFQLRGPLSKERPEVAPVAVNLGTTRDASGRRFASALGVDKKRLHEIVANPSAYYVAFDERRSDGSVRELARDSLSKLCSRFHE